MTDDCGTITQKSSPRVRSHGNIAPRFMARYLLVLCRNHYQFPGSLKSPPFYSDFDKKRFVFGLEIVPQIFLPFATSGFLCCLQDVRSTFAIKSFSCLPRVFRMERVSLFSLLLVFKSDIKTSLIGMTLFCGPLASVSTSITPSLW